MLTTDAFSLHLHLDDVTGQLLTVADPDLGSAAAHQ